MNIKQDFAIELFSNFKKQIEILRNINFSKNLDKITHKQVIPYASYSPWVDDNEFIKTYDIISSNTLVDIYRCFELWQLIKNLKDKKGVVLEVGVWKGGTGSLIAAANPSDIVYLADTFEGVVKASCKDTIYKGGEHSDTNETIVKNLLKKLNITNFEILKGIFPDTVNFGEDVPNIKLCHIDVDTYDSAYDVFNYIWPNIVKGGIVVFDDYGFWGCEGITLLCNNLKNELKDATFIHNLNGHGIFIKNG